MKVFIFIILLFSSLSNYGQPADSSKTALVFLDQAWKLYQNDNFEECLPLLDSCIFYNNKLSSAYSLKYESLWFLKRFAESAETFKKSMPLKENILLVHAYVLLGMLYDQANMRKRANVQYRKAIEIYESGYESPIKGDKSHEGEYLFAFGLLGNKKKWNAKLEEYIKRYPNSNYQQFRKMSRKDLLEFHFAPYAEY